MMSPERTVTVTGYAESKEKNQIANYSAGVNAVKDSKDEAVKEVNDKIKAITEAVKDFGVDPSDIQTQSMSVYQRQESYYDNGVQKSKPGQWDVNNTITVTLRNVNRASAMADLLTKSGATNVYGPNFQLDTSKKAEDSLMTEAIADAKIKAEAMAVASGTGLDKVISVSEGSAGGVSYPLYAMDGRGGGGGVAVEPGSTKISKTVTVVWSLK
ncbi:MAG: outer membrane protein [Candidatus Collierbacteria bacterium GW2011_GWB2_45_17]|uniref:Outer membrane protein n=1 Tax=Candidatus Collierbacteria bacterium GW2011_GWB2_45_17 TaxID=1618388 RepID=A0A837IDL5_9BACT|nr:MAG: outer membrane protein [Microgenomates group bacterium GW2011_GWC1_44_23]KKT98924.1 MAG: outer membrane protein [Candidatus Collierbacteria bacterium GW2011_GWB2_45_17]